VTVTLRADLPVGQSMAWTPLAGALNVVSLGLLAWGITSEAHPGGRGPHLAALVLLAGAAAAWLAWMALRSGPRPGTAVVPLAAMALAGGALAGFAPLAAVFPGVAALGATMGWRRRTAGAVVVAGCGAAVAAVAGTGHHLGTVLAVLAASAAGTVMGISRRQAIELTEQAAVVAVETDRAEVERQRAELLADRNHLARELHDVLAHTLAALSVQLEAFGTVVDADPATSETVREQLERTRQLVHEGLDEARGAVRALRGDTAPLDGQLSKLCAEHQAALSVHGHPRPVPPQVSLGVYRVAQEALTNVMKHAPGTAASVALAFGPEAVTVTVENAASVGAPTALGSSGGGFGLQGIADRIALLGGKVDAGPTAAGWRVAAEVPAPA